MLKNLQTGRTESKTINSKVNFVELTSSKSQDHKKYIAGNKYPVHLISYALHIKPFNM